MPVNSEPIEADVCTAGDNSSGSEVTDSDVSCTCDEDCSIEGPDMRIPSLASVLVGPNPSFLFTFTVRNATRKATERRALV
jgi:hypothetical protein